MNIRNFTPHSIVLFSVCGESQVSIPAETEKGARVDQENGKNIDCLVIRNSSPSTGDEDNFLLNVFSESVDGEIVDLPKEIQENDCIVVSAMVAEAARKNPGKYAWILNNLYRPGTGPKDGAIRNDKKQIVGITRIIKVI